MCTEMILLLYTFKTESTLALRKEYIMKESLLRIKYLKFQYTNTRLKKRIRL